METLFHGKDPAGRKRERMTDMKNKKLRLWQDRLDRAKAAYSPVLDKIEQRERQYAGDETLKPMVSGDSKTKKEETSHVYNITAENIEAEIDSSIPMPKVVPMRKEDEALALMIEHMLRSEIDRLPTEQVNDLAERTAKKQGGVGLLPEWDNSKRTHLTIGENTLRTLHPKRIIPQDGVDELEDMDYYFVRLPMTKSAVYLRYGVDVKDETDQAPELRDGEVAEDLVTVEMAYYRDRETGNIGRYVFCGETELEDLPDCQARHLRRCKKCGMTEMDSAFTFEEPSTDGERPEGEVRRARKGECSFCHSRSWENSTEEYRQVPISELKRYGVKAEIIARLEQEVDYGTVEYSPEAFGVVGEDPVTATPGPLEGGLGEVVGMDGGSEVTVEVPYYTPRDYPLVLMRNVMGYDSFLGESDCDKIADQQNTVNYICQKILDRLYEAGKVIGLPAKASFKVDPKNQKIWYFDSLADAQMVKDFDFEGDISQHMAWLGEVYGQAQRLLGITESFLGRRDATANSGAAKEFAAQQTAGRLESKRILKKFAWSQVYERMFRNLLAYADERRPIRVRNDKGEIEYEEWNPYAFLEMDDAGELWWNDLFLFSCDDASGLAANREAMWKECTAHLQSGAYGNPQDLGSLILYWTNMEELHYPGAGKIKKTLEERLTQQQEMAQQQAMMQQQMPEQQPMM